MTMSQHVENAAGPARHVTWASLAVAVAGVTLFGSIVAGLGVMPSQVVQSGDG